MNPIEITYVAATQIVNVDNTQSVLCFCEDLNNILSKIKLCHLFTNNYDAHKIYGELYDTLSDKFDTLQEEIIGLCRSHKDITFPETSINTVDTDFSDSDCSDAFKRVINELYGILSLSDFEKFVSTGPKNGISNTVEEIYSATNKTDYLLGMALKSERAPESNNLDSETQTDISVGYPIQTILNPVV